jgi:hypothetical protein
MWSYTSLDTSIYPPHQVRFGKVPLLSARRSELMARLRPTSTGGKHIFRLSRPRLSRSYEIFYVHIYLLTPPGTGKDHLLSARRFELLARLCPNSTGADTSLDTCTYLPNNYGLGRTHSCLPAGLNCWRGFAPTPRGQTCALCALRQVCSPSELAERRLQRRTSWTPSIRYSPHPRCFFPTLRIIEKPG